MPDKAWDEALVAEWDSGTPDWHGLLGTHANKLNRLACMARAPGVEDCIHDHDGDLGDDLMERVLALEKERDNQWQRSAVRAFSTGDHVQFPDKRGRTVTGFITKVYQKTVHVEEEGNHLIWKVNASLLGRI